MTMQQFLDKNPQIGQLTRNGKTVYYVNLPVYKEAYCPIDLLN